MAAWVVVSRDGRSAIWLTHEWYSRSWGWDEAAQRSIFAPDLGWNQPTALLAAAALLALLVLAGGPLLKLILRLTKKTGDDPRRQLRRPASQQTLDRPDGSKLLVKMYGPADGPPLVLTHGWGLNSDEWAYAQAELENTSGW